ncbi:hypothetical protein [Microbacterium sp. NPDC056234]|uniref:hypothetical protein n=1 Tax=Microbacterium sp. NPDC056234 TaxID=3345757 RepID=UPI0035E24B79
MRTRRRSRSRIMLAGLLAGVVLAGSSTASAYWSASNTHTGTSVAGYTAPAPATMTCANSGLPPLTQTATVSWSTVAGANRYNVVISRTGGASTTNVVSTTSARLDSGLLGNLLTGLLAPTTLTVRVFPAYVNGSSGLWISPNSRAYTATSVLLPIGTTCGAAVP